MGKVILPLLRAMITVPLLYVAGNTSGDTASLAGPAPLSPSLQPAVATTRDVSPVSILYAGFNNGVETGI